jgi:hypothetical protein
MGLFLSSGHFWFAAGSLFGAGKAVLRPVACDQVRGARGRGQGTETVAKLGGLPASVACVSQRLDAGARGAMMTCDRGFLHSFSVWTVPVGLLRIRGELATGAHLRATDLYTVGSFDPDHDAVMRIGGEAPGGGPILSVGIKCQVRIRHPATSDRQFGSRAEKPARAEMVLSAMLVQVTPFRMLDVRRRPPVVRQW